MKLPCLFKKSRCALGTLHLADRCLLAFMLILMAQAAHNLFFHELAMQESSSFDVIVRTTAAAIFGYFISANFQSRGQSPPEGDSAANAAPRTISSPASGGATAKIGFSAGTEGDPPEPGYAGSRGQEPQQKPGDSLQIIVVTSIGIAALLLLVIAHTYYETSDAATATISQLRDFVSGSVGFLIGHPTAAPKTG